MLPVAAGCGRSVTSCGLPVLLLSKQLIAACRGDRVSLSVKQTRVRALIDAVMTVFGSLGVSFAVVALQGQSVLVSTLAFALGVALASGAALSVVLRNPPFSTPADRVTLVRAVLAGGCATLVTLSVFGAVDPRSWLLIALATPALLLDAVDGWVARRTGTANDRGARLDMETDSAFLLVLSVALALVVGPWALALGMMRYLYGAASWWRPALRQPLTFSSFRRTVAGAQGVIVVIALVPIVPALFSAIIAAFSLALLLVSFGRDVVALERSFARSNAAKDHPAA